ncbi:MAG: ribosome biogenesis GTPase Der [Flavobacteriales bacterium]
MSTIVAIVGRPNVGKSTLFNRLTESREAIVDPSSGTTRDRHYGKCEWGGREFTVIDTGGYISGSDDVFESEINKQVKMAVDECDVVIFMTDVTTGTTHPDLAVADMLRKSKKPVFIVVNKVDNSMRENDVHEFYGLGFGEIFAVSAQSGSGTGELLDEIIKHIKPEEEQEEDVLPKLAVVGRPNVGKSSFINSLLEEDRNIVTPVAGTTRDTIHTRFNKFGFDFWVLDTAGLRKKSKVTENIEFYSVLRTIRAIEECDVAILMLDATQGLESQDLNIIHLVEKNHKGLVVVVNKWDLVAKETNTAKAFEERIYENTAPFRDFPIIFTSVLNKQRVLKALEAAMEVTANRQRRIKTAELNEFFQPLLDEFPPPAIKGKYIKIKYVTQLPGHYPTFAFFCNLPQYVKDPYRRFLENKLRENFNFHGAPIRIFFRQK